MNDHGGTSANDPDGARRALHAIFFDVENSSRPEHVAAILDHLGVALGCGIELIAMGNWRVVSPETANLLSARGAKLVHSAPAPGVKDWSDMRIAVAVGIWLGDARAGDLLEIVTDDQAFDAAGDVAAGLGVGFRRLSFRSLPGASLPKARPRSRRPSGRSTARRGSGRSRRRS